MCIAGISLEGGINIAYSLGADVEECGIGGV